MSANPARNVGQRTADWLFHEQLKVDAEWSVRTANGFRWWADKHAQTVEVVGVEAGRNGERCYLVSVQTELLRSVELTDRAAVAINGIVMPFASMAGPVYDPETRTLSLASLVRTYEGIDDWMKRLVGVAAGLQIGEAQILSAPMADAIHAIEAMSGPPSGGVRREPDELVDLIPSLIAPMGERPCQWTAEEFRECVRHYMEGPPALRAKADGGGFTVSFPFGDRSSTCQALRDEPHPRYGNGLFILQSFPVAKPAAEGARLALALNRSELAERPLGYGFGSYAYRENAMHFTSFLPNLVHQPGILRNVYFSCAQRARELSIRLTGTDWTTAAFKERRRSAK